MLQVAVGSIYDGIHRFCGEIALHKLENLLGWEAFFA
jgi:hypothetical protein